MTGAREPADPHRVRTADDPYFTADEALANLRRDWRTASPDERVAITRAAQLVEALSDGLSGGPSPRAARRARSTRRGR